eukprot:UN04649
MTRFQMKENSKMRIDQCFFRFFPGEKNLLPRFLSYRGCQIT